MQLLGLKFKKLKLNWSVVNKKMPNWEEKSINSKNNLMMLKRVFKIRKRNYKKNLVMLRIIIRLR